MWRSHVFDTRVLLFMGDSWHMLWERSGTMGWCLASVLFRLGVTEVPMLDGIGPLKPYLGSIPYISYLSSTNSQILQSPHAYTCSKYYSVHKSFPTITPLIPETPHSPPLHPHPPLPYPPTSPLHRHLRNRPRIMHDIRRSKNPYLFPRNSRIRLLQTETGKSRALYKNVGCQYY